MGLVVYMVQCSTPQRSTVQYCNIWVLFEHSVICNLNRNEFVVRYQEVMQTLLVWYHCQRTLNNANLRVFADPGHVCTGIVHVPHLV